ncbi:MAG: glycine cleavage system aminomethyltransferase GcvT [Chloroflexi bacterium]|nr:glycine cleavage system aminomethyltransferase GcvT [Chloroflexota bacterium]
MTETALRETPLSQAHDARGARMVAFGGWRMPLQYQGILAEHLHTRAAAGLFDLSHMGRLSITGPQALDLIQRAATNDASRLRVGAAQYSLLCNEAGGVIDDILVYRATAGWRLMVNASNRERVVAHLEALREQHEYQADLDDRTMSTVLLGLQGPDSLAVLQPLVQSDLEALRYYHFVDTELADGLGPASISRSGYTGEDGFEITMDGGDAPALWTRLLADDRVQPVGLGARDTLRLEAGMALYGHELGETITPYEANLGRVVRLDKGPFVGSEALARLAGQAVARLLVGITLERGSVPRQGNLLQVGQKTIGAIASGTFSPTLKHPIATVFVPPAYAAPGTELGVLIRDSAAPARVVSLPFVSHQTKVRPPGDGLPN